MPTATAEPKDEVRVSEAPETTTDPASEIVTMSRTDLMAMMEQVAERAVKKAQLASEGQGPPKAMKAKVADGFIKPGEGGRGMALAHYRVEGIMAQKIAEYDMERLRYYQGEGADELPIDDKGRPISAKTFATKRKQWITIANGDIRPTTQNQIEQLLWMKDLPEEEGGLPGLYEVIEGGETWTCHVCRPNKSFQNKETWENHRLATHGIPREAAA